MLIFNNLKIDSSSKQLTIDVLIQNSIYTDNTIIKSVVIDTQNTYIPGGPSNNSIYFEDFSNNHTQNLHLNLTEEDLKVSVLDNVFFVYISTIDTSAETPTEEFSMEMVFSTSSIYNQAVIFSKELKDECNIPKKFIDYILNLKAFEFATLTSNYQKAAYHWKNLFRKYSTNNKPFNCSCYGHGN